MSDKPTWLERATPLKVAGAYVISIERHEDHRGYFQEIFSTQRYDCNLPHAAQVNVAKSRRNVVRGLHVANFTKLCTVLRGKVFDVVADARKGSPTFGKWDGIVLDDRNCKQLYVPAGCAHGYYVFEDDTLFCYCQDGLYDPSTEQTIHWTDSLFNIQWPVPESYILSDRDLNAKDLQS